MAKIRLSRIKSSAFEISSYAGASVYSSVHYNDKSWTCVSMCNFPYHQCFLRNIISPKLLQTCYDVISMKTLHVHNHRKLSNFASNFNSRACICTHPMFVKQKIISISTDKQLSSLNLIHILKEFLMHVAVEFEDIQSKGLKRPSTIYFCKNT